MLGMSVGFKHKPTSESIPSFPPLSGGLRISVDGQVLGPSDLNKSDSVLPQIQYAEDGDQLDHPSAEYLGEDLGLTLVGIFDAFEPFIHGNAERHKEYIAEMEGEPGTILLSFSHLDGDSIRIAVLPRTFDLENQPPLRSQVGFPISPAAFATELSDCFKACIEYTRIAYIETERWADFQPEFDEFKEGYLRYIQTLDNIS